MKKQLKNLTLAFFVVFLIVAPGGFVLLWAMLLEHLERRRRTKARAEDEEIAVERIREGFEDHLPWP